VRLGQTGQSNFQARIRRELHTGPFGIRRHIHSRSMYVQCTETSCRSHIVRMPST
jgi:hypothetical protein